MRRVFTLLGVVALAFILTAGTSAITVLMFPGKFIFNGQLADAEGKHGILLYNDRAYVPLRHAAELLGAKVFYDHEAKQISIYQMDGRRLISEINASTAQSGYHLSIYSGKKTYNVGESLQIWSVLRNDSEETKHFASGDPEIVFYFKDNQGNIFLGNMQNTVWKATKLGSNDQIHVQLPYSQQQYYLVQDDAIHFLGENKEPYHLPAGKYVVGALAQITDLAAYADPDHVEEKEKLELRAEIEIEIKVTTGS